MNTVRDGSIDIGFFKTESKEVIFPLHDRSKLLGQSDYEIFDAIHAFKKPLEQIKVDYVIANF